MSNLIGQLDAIPPQNASVIEPESQDGYAGLVIEGKFWHWDEPMSEPAIALRKIRDKVQKAINVAVAALALGAVALFALILTFTEDKAEAITLEYWVSPNFASFAVWSVLLCVLFLFYRVQDKKLRVKTIPEHKKGPVSEVQMIPSLDGVGKKENIANVLTADARVSLEEAYQLARQSGQAEVEAIHIYLGLLSSPPVSLLFMRLGVTFEQMKGALRRRLATLPKGDANFGLPAHTVVTEALRNAVEHERPQLSAIELFIESYNADEFLQELMFSLEVEKQELENAVMWIRINEQLQERYKAFREAASFKPSKNMNRSYTAVATPFLDKRFNSICRNGSFADVDWT